MTLINYTPKQDTATAVTEQLVDCLYGCLRAEEIATAREEIYRRVLAGLEAYQIIKMREAIRAAPSAN